MVAGAKAVDRSYSGTTKIHRLDENVGAVKVELVAADLKEIGELLANVPVQGARYTEAMIKTINR